MLQWTHLGIIVAFQDAIIIIIDRFAVLLAYAVSVQTHLLVEPVFELVHPVCRSPRARQVTNVDWCRTMHCAAFSWRAPGGYMSF